MTRFPVRRSIVLVALVALLAAASSASAATWHRLSPPGQSNTSQLSLLRNADGSLTAVGLFKSATLGGSDVVKVPISAGGAVGGVGGLGGLLVGVGFSSHRC